jgi:hypothetical protein
MLSSIGQNVPASNSRHWTGAFCHPSEDAGELEVVHGWSGPMANMELAEIVFYLLPVMFACEDFTPLPHRSGVLNRAAAQ